MALPVFEGAGVGYSSRYRWIVVSSLILLIILSLTCPIWAQGLPQSPYSAPSVVRGGLDLAPSNPLGLPSAIGPRTSDSILLTPQLFQGILPQIPNLQVGYLYSFGKAVKSGRLTTDFLVPISLSRDSTAFGEAHGEFQDFWKTATGGAINRIDFSFGGGFRTIRGANTLLGVNGFYDTTRLGGRWYSSGSLGFEMAALLPGNDALDLNFNWYGNLFNSNVLANAFRRGPQNYDFGAGYSLELWNGGPDLRLSATGYRFSAGSGVYGIRGGAEAKTRNGMFSVKYEAAHDGINHTYHTVGGFVNVGLQLENLLSGKSPFVMPEPIFRSPRNLRELLVRKVRREWHQPGAVVVTSNRAEGCDDGPRHLDSVELEEDPGGAIVTWRTSTTRYPLGRTPFTPVCLPYLNRGQRVQVEVFYETGIPSGVWVMYDTTVRVYGASAIVSYNGSLGLSRSGLFTVTLTGTQDTFIDSGQEPRSVELIFSPSVPPITYAITVPTINIRFNVP